MSEQAVVSEIIDPDCNTNAKRVACWMDEMYLAAHAI
jgi:hypothetical protein